MRKNIFTAFLLLIACSAYAQHDLNSYVQAAQKNSPLITDNQNQSKANKLEVERLKAFYTKPQIGITANYLFSPIISNDGDTKKLEPNTAGATNYSGYDLAISNSGLYQGLLGITQPLFNGQRYKTFADQANINAQVYQNNAKLNKHDIEKIITDQYILCLQDNKQADYALAMVGLLEEQKDLIQKLVESGIYKRSDLTLILIEYQNFLGQLTTFRANYRRDLMDLNILCGINDTTLVTLDIADLKLTGSTNTSAFSEKYRLDSLNLVATQKNFELKYKPQLSVFANTGLNAVYAPTIPNRFGMSAGISFTYNFFDGNQRNITRNKTDVLLKSISFYKDNFITQNTVRKTKILTELQSYDGRILIAQQQLKEYEALLSAYKKEILSGQLSIISYVTTLKNMAALQRDYTLLFSQKDLLINTYNYWNW